MKYGEKDRKKIFKCRIHKSIACVVRRSVICLVEDSKAENRKNEAEAIVEETTANHFPEMMKEIDLHISKI